MTVKASTGPLASGSWGTKSVIDTLKSRTQIKYVISETDGAVGNLTVSDAITFAISFAATDSLITGMNPDQADISLNNASGRRLGPKKVEVILTYANLALPPGQDPGTDQLFSMRLNTAQVRVYRRPYITIADTDAMPTNCDGSAGTPTCGSGQDCWNADISSCIVPALSYGLPNGDWIFGAPPSSNPAFSGAAYYNFANWPVPEVSIAIPAKLSNASYQGLFSGTNAVMPLVGYHNDDTFAWNSIDFAAGSCRIDGVHADWVTEGTNTFWYVQYYLTWRPLGWYVQDIVPLSTNTSVGTTAIFSVAEPQANFANKFPLS